MRQCEILNWDLGFGEWYVCVAKKDGITTTETAPMAAMKSIVVITSYSITFEIGLGIGKRRNRESEEFK